MVGLLAGCTAPPPAADLTTLVGTAAQHDGRWRQGEMAAGGLRLAVAVHPVSVEDVLTIYIEGDGRAFSPNGGISFNPTPANPMGLKLALEDAGNVLYVARPCQFVDIGLQPLCSKQATFTDQRWGQDVVESYRAALQPYIVEAKGVRLVGYSGGAYIALAVASRMPLGSVREVVTVAGNLNPNAVQKAHGMAVLDDVATLNYGVLRTIPQIHYVGTRDRVITSEVKEAYLAEAGLDGQAAVAAGLWRWVEVDATHGEGWESLQLPVIAQPAGNLDPQNP